MPEEQKEPAKDAICDECWPDGWPFNCGSAACEHGEWHRKVPVAERKAAGV